MNPAAPSGREPGARHQPALEDNGRKQRNKGRGVGRVLQPQDVDGKAVSESAWGLFWAVQSRNANKEGKNPGLVRKGGLKSCSLRKVSCMPTGLGMWSRSDVRV